MGYEVVINKLANVYHLPKHISVIFIYHAQIALFIMLI